MYKCYKLLLKTQYGFATIMHFLLLLPALAACTAGVPLKSTKPRIDARIMGGDTGCNRQAPYQVSLHNASGYFFCSAVIISDQWVLTAAHCLRVEGADHVTAGSTSHNSGGSFHRIIRYIEHDDCNVTTTNNDIALLKVEKSFESSQTVGRIDLEENEVIPDIHAVVSGWGVTRAFGDTSDVLRFLDVRILNNAACQRPNDTAITPQMICAGSPIENTGTCFYDSGGPLVAHDKRAGLVSWGPKPCATGRPDLYTKISAVREWIRENSGV